jgi:hypothetical protein
MWKNRRAMAAPGYLASFLHRDHAVFDEPTCSDIDR